MTLTLNEINKRQKPVDEVIILKNVLLFVLPTAFLANLRVLTN